MLSQKEKATITRKYQKRMKSACQNLLAKRYGVDKVEPYWQKVEERYNQMLDEAPDIGGEANSMSHNLYEVAWIIALYDVVGRNLTKEEIDTVIHDVMEDGLNTLHKIPGKFLLERKFIRKLIIKSLDKYQKKLEPHLHKDWHNTWGMEVQHDIDDGIHFVLRGCPIKDYCEKHGMMEILPYFCNMDHQMIQALQLYLIRSKTCSNGDDICEYTIVTNENPLVDNNPIFVKDDGLILTKKI